MGEILTTRKSHGESSQSVSEHCATMSKIYKLLKVKFTPEQATKAQRWSRGIALLFL
jgi:hypothetical protein